MIVCICANVNEQQIIDKIKEGKNLKQLKEQLDVANRCASCEPEIIRMLKIYGNKQSDKK